jgi:hypothetical protein
MRLYTSALPATQDARQMRADARRRRRKPGGAAADGVMLAFDEFIDIYLLLQESLGGNVDYGTREGLHPVLRPEIEREAVRVF